MPLVDCGSGVRLERGVPCRLSDGVTLLSDHYYPEGNGPWPTLLMRQPYGRDIASTVVYAHPVWFARHGYHVAIQDVRGRGDSEGTFYPFRSEGRDGAETIAWLRRHEACNGRVGMYGFSYQGATQLLAAAEQPEGLECIAPHMTAANLYDGWFYHQGALRLSSSLGWGIQMLREDARRLGLRGASNVMEQAWANLKAQASFVPYGKHPALTDDNLPSYVRDWVTNREGGEYWAALDVSTRLDKITVPALHLAGWFDTYLTGSVDGYLGLRAGAGSAFARDNQYMIAGPWVHIPWGDQVGDVNLGEAATVGTDSLLLRWFNSWLKDTGEWEQETRVRYFALGANQWRSAEEWPTTVGAPLYLHSLGKANSRRGDGWLCRERPDVEEPRDVFVYDPEVPVLAPGLSGPSDQAAMEMGNNLLVYISEPAGGPVICGDLGSARRHHCKTGACADQCPRGVCIDRRSTKLMALPRYGLLRGQSPPLGVCTGTNGCGAVCRRAAPAGGCQLSVPAL
jgi:putative CocE/NonD family hydrolase